MTLIGWIYRLGAGGALGVILAVIPAGLGAQGGPPELAPLDLTANGVVDAGDAATAASAWADLAPGERCAPGALAAADVDADGCVSVADVQRVAAAVGAAPGAAPAAAPAQAGAQSTWVVNTAADGVDVLRGDGICRTDRGTCTLRAAIQEANRSPGPDLISFDVREPNGSCPERVRIFPDSAADMLALDDPLDYGTTIDGYSQCGARPNSEPVRGDAVIKVELQGTLVRNIHGLRILSAGNTVRGLAVFAFDRQIEIFGERARYNRIEGNFLGTNATQTFQSRDLGTHHSEGIRLQLSAAYNVVGCGSFGPGEQFQPCADPAQAYAARNIVAGNGNDGVHFERGAHHNHVVGNYVGLRQDGLTAHRNGADGVDIEQGPQHNWLGGLTALERNVIAGNNSDGIEISHGTRTQFNHVAGNYFGLDASGTRAVRNRSNGISFEDTVDQNYAHGNVVAGNGSNGFRFYVLATRNEVRGNVVGFAGDGTTPMPNGHNGVYVMGGSQRNLIAENVIAHNRDHGIFLASTSDADHNGIGETYYNTISRNRIFQNRLLGIQILGKRGIFPNQALPAPTLTRAATGLAEGTTCPGCTVEIFLADKTALPSGADDDRGEGMRWLGTGTADAAGVFSVALSGAELGQVLTATATDPQGNTSVFGRNRAVDEVTPSPPTPVPPTPDPNPGPPPTATRTPGEGPPPQIWLPQVVR